MTDMQILIDTYLYFARFPLLAGVQKTFNTGEGKSQITGYDIFKQTVDDLAAGENSLCPEILDYIFASNEDRVIKKVGNISNYYLMLDYGQVQKRENNYSVVENSFFIALTVARPYSEEDMDDAEEILIAQECITLLNKIYEYAKADKTCPLMKFNFTGGFMPFDAPKLDNSIGWTWELTREGHLND